MKEYKVMASSMTATYTAGKVCADTPQQAVEKARQNYANSQLGRNRLNRVPLGGSLIAKRTC